MKTQYLSDLHIDHKPYTFKLAPEADVIVVAGDIINTGNRHHGYIKKPHEYGRQMIKAIASHGKPVVVVPGNHDYYGMCLRDSVTTVRYALGEGLPNVHVLDNQSIELAGVNFFGAVLWPSMDWFGCDRHFNLPDPIAYNDFLLPRAVQDFTVTWCGEEFVKPSDMRAMHQITVDKLRALCDGANGPQVVVTHFAPSKLSINERFENNQINPFFVNRLIMSDFKGVKLWIHGHCHDPSSYEIADIKVRCNPRGYPGEKSGFDPEKVEEL